MSGIQRRRLHQVCRAWASLSASALWLTLPVAVGAAENPPLVPRFSMSYVDRSVDPKADFYQFATGAWRKNNPVPSDKSRWAGFDELQERNWWLIRGILVKAAAEAQAPAASPLRQVGDFFAAAMDTNRIERLGFTPLDPEWSRLKEVRDPETAMALLADWHLRGIAAGFGMGVQPDAKDSSVYALHFVQGGLGLPDRDYYLAEGFTSQRDRYRRHIAAQLRLLGDGESEAGAAAEAVLALETRLAKASRTRTELRDREKNYHKLSRNELDQLAPHLPWGAYFRAAGITDPATVIVGQPEFFKELDRMVSEVEADHWLAYLRWHLVSSLAEHLHAAPADESFGFYGTVLRGQPQQEPRWQRAAKSIDGALGEALGRLYVQEHFPPAAAARMSELIANLRGVFRERLGKLEWMGESTRRQALQKFDRFTEKVGHPKQFRDYSGLEIRRDDHLGNVLRANVFESRRELARIGKRVDRAEWHMTPQTVNAYFSPPLNEIVFPAGILQPPFFDLEMDDAVNYGAIGVVIGHEITHGYDDQGRKYDAEGNLRDWWTEADGKEFDRRAAKVVDQYGAYEALPGKRVNGRLTLGENIADLGGTSIAFEALQRALAKDPSRRRVIDGLTPEQRFFLSLSQLWRVNWREAELQRRLVVDPHSPGQFRGIGPHVNLPEFYQAWGITETSPLWRKPEDRAKIW
jgi:putative endopeptidase